jgi:amino acid adenylation domain-containing protein
VIYLLDQLVRSAAERAPDSVAVRFGDSTLTYGALDEGADRVAAVLADQGVRSGDRVGIHTEKSLRTVASLYGVLRAGAAYVPIDPAAPPLRGAYVATDCSVAAMITDAARLEALRDADAAAVPRGILVDGGSAAGFVAWDEVESAVRSPSRAARTDVDLAYVLYTSGSTGRPKGVAISHRSSLTFVTWARDKLGLAADDVLSSHAPFHFDLSTLDLYGAAAAGAAVSLVPAAAAMFPVRLGDWIREQRISVWYSVPSALTMLVRYGNLDERPLESLRLVVFAGEVFPVRYLGELMGLVPHARFFNLYGPTETNVCTYEEVTSAPAPDDPPIPIGRACENTRCTVVDGSGGVVTEVGAEGELVVTGSSVARGYWGDAERTAQAFPDPFTYRTGDIVEILDDSPSPRYRFVGRRDHMVKTRGYRVELGEVESALFAHPSVSECVAVAVPDELLTSRIVAFCVVDGDADAHDLTRACRERLPTYMVPAEIHVLDSLPRTPNDKYDRAALAERAAHAAQPTS